MSKEKDRITKQFQKKREKLSEDDIQKGSAMAWKQLQALECFQTAKSIMFYMPIGGEIDFTGHFRDLHEQGVEISIPILDEEDGEIQSAIWTPDEVLVPRKYNILEPEIPQFTDLQKLDVILMPGVAFDIDGGRVGFGKGYYDRFLKTCHAIRIGAAYDFQLKEKLPTNELDVPMDYIVTPTKTLHIPDNYHAWRFFGSDI